MSFLKKIVKKKSLSKPLSPKPYREVPQSNVSNTSHWEKLLKFAQAKKVALYASLTNIISHEETQGNLKLFFKEEDSFSLGRVEQEKSWLQTVWREITGQASVEISIASKKQSNKSEKTSQTTLTKRSNSNIINDPVVKNVCKTFEGKVKNIISK